MATIPLPGRGQADIPFDGFDAFLAEVVQQQGVIVSQQPHQSAGTLLGGGIDPALGTACLALLSQRCRTW
jgi:hypothetical protein